MDTVLFIIYFLISVIPHKICPFNQRLFRIALIPNLWDFGEYILSFLILLI